MPGTAQEAEGLLVSATGRDLESILQPDRCDLQRAINVFDVAFDISHQIVCRLDLPHIQCGSQGAGQSPSDTSDDVVQCRWILRSGDLPPVFLLVEVFDSAVNTEMQWIIEVFNVGRAVRPLVFLDTNSTRVGNGHMELSFLAGSRNRLHSLNLPV